VKKSQPGWQHLKVIKHRSGYRLTGISIQVVYGDPEEVIAQLGKHTSYVERVHLSSRQMNGRLVRKTLSYSKEVELLKAASAWEDWVYNLTYPVKTLRVKINDGSQPVARLRVGLRLGRSAGVCRGALTRAQSGNGRSA